MNPHNNMVEYVRRLIIKKMDELWDLGYRSKESLAEQFIDRFGVTLDCSSTIETFIRSKQDAKKESSASGISNDT